MTPTGTLSTLASFTGTSGSTLGSSPRAGLALGRDGNFYGTTEKGGTYDLGTVFQITPDGVLTTILSFDSSNGSYPWGRLVSSGGYLYGTTSAGGISPLDSTSGGGGQIFRVRVYADVLTGIADPIAFNTALLHGTANPLEQNTTVSFEYGTDSTLATFSTVSASVPGGTGNDFVAVPSPLAPLTTYYYRAVNTLADGVTKIRGDIQSFTTLPAPPDIAVDAGGQTNLTSDGAPVIVPNTTVGQSRDFAITIRTSTATSTLTSLSASIPEQSGAFSILQQPSASVAYGGTTTLVVRFTPVITGGGTATISIVSDDVDENPFIIHLRAWGGTTFSPVIDPSNPEPVAWDGFIATGITLSGTTLTGPPHRGTEYVILSNPGDTAVTGTFNGLPEGSLVILTYGGNSYRFLLSYEGGDGNDIVLSYWPETGINPSDSPEAFLFAALDSDRDDRLTLTEWQGIYAKIPKKETIFTAIDTNPDGFLSFAEFTAGATNRTASRTISTAVNRTAVFMEVDTSYDNIVSRAEIAFMWKPGTAAKTIDSYWTRAKGGDGMDFWDWLWASSLPSFTTYDQAQTARAQRLAIAGQLDTDTSGTITFEEFSHLYKAGTKTATIDTAWRAANATPRGTASPADMTVNAFVEAAKLPKLTVF
ncbi:MAG: EF-hand domain-containing protein [Luteolibacter sp.]